MDFFTRADLNRLAEWEREPAVSIYVPTHRTGREVRQNATRLKNALSEAVDKLATRGMRRSEAEQLLEPARQFQTDGSALQQSDGLAVFAGPELFRYYRVPLSFDQQVTVGVRFRLHPLIPLLEGDGRFLVLALSQNRVRLLEGSHFTVRELHPENLPESMQEALKIDEYQDVLQHHSTGTAMSADLSQGAGPRGTTAGQTQVHHGQGSAGKEIEKRDEILQFFHRIDRGLNDFFHDERVPLVFAGVEYLFPLFRETCSYASLVDRPAAGNPDELDATALHHRAWPLVEPIFQETREALLRRYGDHASRDLATSEVEQVVVAARRGQVETLLAAAHAELRGTVDETTGETNVSDAADEEAEDLVNYATIQTLIHSGEVMTIPSRRMPNGAPLAAVLRYPAEARPAEPTG